MRMEREIVNNIKARYNYPRLKFKMFSHGTIS